MLITTNIQSLPAKTICSCVTNKSGHSATLTSSVTSEIVHNADVGAHTHSLSL